MSSLPPLPLAKTVDLETPAIWRALVAAHQPLAELKGLCTSLPNPSIFIETLSIQEAKDSSEIENIITTHDELYASQDHGAAAVSRAAKEVRNYVAALRVGAEAVSSSGLIRLDTILAVQAQIEQNRAGLRQLPGTVLKNETTGRVVFEPPQSAVEVRHLMDNLIEFIHADDGMDPLLRMAIVHHQFESIHPFYDGNGRTGRIVNILMLIREGLLTVPILYLSRYIHQTRNEYYRLLRSARDEAKWGEWCLYLLRGIAMTARHELALIRQFQMLMDDYQERIRREFHFHSQDLLNNLFRYPYTKIEFVERELGVSRPTATKYLDQLAHAGYVEKTRKGRSNYFINRPLFNLLTNPDFLA